MNLKPKGMVPLERALSKRGLASRKEARELIEQGLVTVNGKVIKDALFLVVPETMQVTIAGKKNEDPFVPLFLVFNKPKSCVTTTKDEKNRKTVYDYLDLKQKVISVGRLDFATTGLLFFTNVNRIMDFLTDPQNQIERTYAVTVRGEVSPETIQKLITGIREGEDFLKAKKVEAQKISGKESHLQVTLEEGKNREIRRLFGAFNHEVTSLKRISYGGFELGDLENGNHREVKFSELAEKIPQTKSLLQQLKLI